MPIVTVMLKNMRFYHSLPHVGVVRHLNWIFCIKLSTYKLKINPLILKDDTLISIVLAVRMPVESQRIRVNETHIVCFYIALRTTSGGRYCRHYSGWRMQMKNVLCRYQWDFYKGVMLRLTPEVKRKLVIVFLWDEIRGRIFQSQRLQIN